MLFNVTGIALVCFLGSGELASELVVLCAVAVAVALSYVVYREYRVAARELKRLESVTKSPMLAFFSETLAGAAVFRAFGAQPRALALADARVDDANRALFSGRPTSGCASANGGQPRDRLRRQDCAVAGVAPRGGDAGLTLSYPQFVQAIMWLFRIFTQLEVR